MTIDGDGDKDLPDEDKVTGDGLVHEGKNAIKDNEIKVETVNIGVNDGGRGTLQAKCLQLQQQRQSQGAVFGWERFLHVTSIKVLLVENDDSTRHIVTALLRKCNYEVIKAANGLQAWKILENVSNHIDLVLTEVVMPCLSGIGLLYKIMSHNTRKNIPVIMMSSHDSMGLVFKCLSKGAADFLLKPIRKNELKNLWQHVWRRCHSSSGSGSESGTQTQKSVKSKSSEKCANNSGSDDGEDNGSNGLDIGDGSGSQSSWTKHAVEVDSSQAVSPRDQVPESPDSTCAQVNRSNAETSATRRAHMNASRGCQEADPSKPFATGILRNMESQPDNVIEVPPKLIGAKYKSPLVLDSNTSSLKMDKKQENPISNCPSTEYHVVTTEMSHPQIDSKELNKVMDVLESNNILIDDSKVSVVEISLKRLRGLKESGITFQDDRNVLRRSELSAFSRYNSSSNPTRTPNGITGSSFLNDNSIEVAQIFLNPSSDGVSNNIDMGSTTNKLTIKPLPLGDKSEATPSINVLHPSSAFKPVKNVFRNSLQQAPQVKRGDVTTAVIGPQGSHIDILIQHHKHHHVHNLNQRCSSKHEDLPLKKLGVDGPFCAPSNILAGPCERNPEYDSLNRGASGSNPGSDVHNRCSTAINDRGANEESDTGLAGKSGSGDACGSGCGNTMVPSKLERAAALTKFCQRRKDKNKVTGITERD